MGDEPRARQAINLDHERRLIALEREFKEYGRVTALEDEVRTLRPEVNEVLLAKRVADGITRELQARGTLRLGRWTKTGIGFAIAGTILTAILELARALGHL